MVERNNRIVPATVTDVRWATRRDLDYPPEKMSREISRINEEKTKGTRAHEIEHAPDIDPWEERILVCPIAKRLIDYTECMELYDVCSYMIKPDHYDELLDLDTFDQKKRNICLNCHYLYYDD